MPLIVVQSSLSQLAAGILYLPLLNKSIGGKKMRLSKEQAADKQVKFRSWQSILYEDSAPPDWRDRISERHVEVFVSPLHDKDVTAAGEPKKPHYHIIVMYANSKATWQADEFFEYIGALHGFASDGKTAFESVDNLRGASRYLVHMDDYNKYRYPDDSVTCFGGADYLGVCELPSDDDEIVSDIVDWVNKYKCTSYRALITYARDEQRRWFRFLNHKGARHIYQILKSAQWELEKAGGFITTDEILYTINDYGKKVDRATGAIVDDAESEGMQDVLQN